ncbi:MAG: PolC-type DNA polymerase III [Firmicutes bacterium]|nr:PolC-type DNA polymerase III [Bacillota bacterium]
MKMCLADFFNRTKNSLMKNTEIINVEIVKEKKEITVTAKFNALATLSDLNALQRQVCEDYKLNFVKILPKYDKALFGANFLQTLVDYISAQTPVAMSVLAGASASYLDNVLSITLTNNGVETLAENNFSNAASELIKQLFDIDVEVTVKAQANTFENYENEKAKRIQKLEKENLKRQVKENPVIFGREIKGNRFDPIKDLTEASGKALIMGELFAKSITVKETRNKTNIVTFGITDFEGSITCKLFGIENTVVARLEQRLKKGVNIAVRGDVQYDKYMRDTVVLVEDINVIPKQMRQDNADEKRVELHLHTKMSFMDAMVNVEDAVKRAKSWGHKALAITDHGVVQAFPDAAQEAGDDLKVIFGVEAYLTDNGRPIAFNTKGQTLCADTVVFDVETTGFNPESENIIEIGAVKIKDGKIVDNFSAFINPQKPIPQKIVKLTGITDELVRDAETIDVVLPRFLEFCKDSLLVAHNAGFDISFIKANAKRLDIPFSPAYVDTVEMARGALPDLSSHKLNVVADALGVSLEGHHRAVNDANATALIYLKLVEMCKVQNADELNEAFDKGASFKDKKYYHAVILAKNKVGLLNLYKIISKSHLHYFYKRPCMPKSLFFQHREGLIIGTACEQGELFQAILAGAKQKQLSKIVRMYDYLEIQPLGNNEFLIRNDMVKSKDELIAINKKIIELGDYFNKPVVATCDVHFLDRHDSIYRAILMAGQGYSDADNQAPLYFRTTDEMLAEFDYLPPEKAFEVVVTNTNKIADMCEKLKPVPSGTFPPIMGDSKEEIIKICFENAKHIYGEQLPEIVENRMNKELASINKYGFSVMYLIAHRLVKKSKDDGYKVGSRGSVGSSFVAFLSGITEVNALAPHYVCKKCKHSEFITDGSIGSGIDLQDKDCPNCGERLLKDGHDIPFETFLGFEGDKEPDIDLNFSGEYQAIAHKYTEELFGKDNVFRAGTISTLADKTAFGYVKGYLDERDVMASSAEVNRLVEGCSGVKRTTGQHPGGVMILPKGHDIHEFCPIQHPADDKTKGVITTHFDYRSISGRLLKLDILGHADPTMLKILEDSTGIDSDTIPLDDEKTMSLFTSTDALNITPEQIGSTIGTFGIPELGTRFVRQMLLDTKPSTFSELVRISGLSHGTSVWTNNAQELIRNKTATLTEVICTRDDIMLFLIYSGLPSKAAFDIMERVRKGKGLTGDSEKLMREHNIPEWYIDSCNKIKYMFPKAHAVAYITMALKIAWFKVHRPLAFYMAHFTVRASEFNIELMCSAEQVRKTKNELESKPSKELSQKDKDVLTLLESVNEMYARGIEFLPIDIHKSDTKRFLECNGNILPPLCAIAGLGESAAESIVEARETQPFSSVEDLHGRTSISKTVLDSMQQQGCLKGLPLSDQICFF